jgi:two-component system nitrogen regulation sensor histidine kinase NtrY
VAHEIKNPLTPIRLSAERLKRRYSNEINTDPEVFARCTDTIIRQVVAIGRMVDEFSAFARMPSPVLKPENAVELMQRAVFLQREAHPGIEFVGELPRQPLWLRCDERQIGQVLTNLLQNAIQSIRGRETPAAGELERGRIETRAVEIDGQVVLEVLDNGRGLPTAQRDRLFEPYVTTRAKGAGLGLAIVKKIAEDHGAHLSLGDRPQGGACARIVFSAGAEEAEGAEADEPRMIVRGT